MANQKKQAIVGLVTLVVLIGAILGAVYGGRTLWGGKIGEKCDDDFSCQPGSICISKRCRRSCKVDGDCQKDWMCRPTEVSVTRGGDARNGFELTSVKICFSPEAMAPALARERAQALEEKKHDVRRQTIVDLVVSPPQLTDAQFDAAWARIPPAEQSSSTVSALSKRVIAIVRAPH